MKFLYIDDETLEKSKGLILNLLGEIQKDHFEYVIEQPKTWNEQKAHLIEERELDNYDGLLLDLKLQFSEGDDNNVRFSGPDLAQTIRSEVRAGKIKDLPIFLYSTNDNFKDLLDRTSIDLFDKMYSKNKDLDQEETKKEFISFANAYKVLKEEDRSVENLMKKTKEENEELISLEAELGNFKTPHEFIYLIKQYVIQSNGLLIDEELLAIRLGIDIKNSPNWKELKQGFLNEFKYSGILGDCCERWWQSELLNKWKMIVGKSLLVMTAQEKVDAIKEVFNLSEIQALGLPKFHNYDTFWYKCRLSNTPLDPSDALRTIEMPRYVWQEPSYISKAYIKSDERVKSDILSLLGGNELKIFSSL
ncbi:hypothetical protein [Myroides odoratimimus]|uniref:hypothetical protein n=1 Tax=Myroides odoratimimus TaxID=76832 RepID=UPI002DBC4A6E|nr:hypothetical protein [Myroides odoratimimus]MEC4028516.1 hypothetical protein [Myroides odoratimimus]